MTAPTQFVLNGVVFVLIGLQLPYVLAGIRGEYGLGALLVYGALFSALVILLRLFWVFPGAHFAYFIRRRLLGQQENTPPPRQIFVVGWTGMRGVIALAAAMSLPRTLSDGSPFPRPGRATMVFSRHGDGWLCVHSHMSLNRGVPQTSHADRPVKAW